MYAIRSYYEGVHAKLQCVACHTDIADNAADHKKVPGATPPDCAGCHQKLWQSVETSPAGTETNKKRLGVVFANIAAYNESS